MHLNNKKSLSQLMNENVEAPLSFPLIPPFLNLVTHMMITKVDIHLNVAVDTCEKRGGLSRGSRLE